jgi:hypothetical protein
MDQNNQQLIKGSIITVIVAGILGALSVLAGGIGIATIKIFSLSLTLLIFGVTATISLVVTNRAKYRTLGTAGVFVSALGFLLTAVIVIGEAGDEGVMKLAVSLLLLSIALAHICLLHHFTLQNKYAVYARTTATVAISVFTLVLILRIFEPLQNMYMMLYNQGTLKLVVASLIVDLSATLLVPLCNRLQVEEQQYTVIEGPVAEPPTKQDPAPQDPPL